ncbi:hypothetical protein DFJ74DRAFT_670830 [Hyaloraphidium curvatum]|nr:hypothetical protein DFJ74DRAFT_670830 [Hyaloraphidium curvatum]
MGKDRTGQRTKGNAQPTSAARAADLIAGSASAGFGGAFGIPAAVSAPIATGINLSAEQEVENAVSGELKVTLRKLAKRDAVTRVKAVEELRAYLEQADPDKLLKLLPAWPSLFGRLSTDVERRAREQIAGAHLVLVRKVRKDLAPYLKDLAGPWICAFFDPSKDVSRSASEAWNEAFSSPKKRADALDFVQPSVLNYLATNLLEHTPETLSDARFVTPTEMEEKYARTVAASLKALGYLVRELSREQREKCGADYGRIFDSTRFWGFAVPPSAVQIRRTSLELTAELVTRWQDVLRERLAMICPIFPGKAFSEQDGSAHGEMWQAVLLFTKAFPQSWTSQLSASKSKDKTVASRLLSFLAGGCFGSGTVSYPSLLPLLSLLPAEVLNAEFCDSLFDSLWKGYGTGNVDRSSASSLVVAYAECLLLILGRMGKAGGDQLDAVGPRLIESAVSRLAKELLEASHETAAKVTADAWSGAIAKITTRVFASGNATIASVPLGCLEKLILGGIASRAEVPDFGLFCSRAADLLAAVWESLEELVVRKDTTELAGSNADKRVGSLYASITDAALSGTRDASDRDVASLTALASRLIPLVGEADLTTSISGFFSDSFQGMLKSQHVSVESLKPMMELLAKDPALSQAYWAQTLGTSLKDTTGGRRLDVVDALLEASAESSALVRSTGLPRTDLDEYVEQLLIQRMGKLLLSESVDQAIVRVVSRSLAGEYLSKGCVDRMCLFVSGWLSEFVTAYLVVSGSAGHSVSSLALNTAVSTVDMVAFVTERRGGIDWFPASALPSLVLDLWDLAAFTPLTLENLEFDVVHRDGTVDSGGQESCQKLQSSSAALSSSLLPRLLEAKGDGAANEFLARWGTNFRNPRHCGTSGEFAAQLVRAFACQSFPPTAKQSWARAEVPDIVPQPEADPWDVSDSEWLKLGEDAVPRAFDFCARENDANSSAHRYDVHGQSELARRSSMLAEVARELGPVALVTAFPSEEDSLVVAARLVLAWLRLLVVSEDAKTGLAAPLASFGPDPTESIEQLLDAFLDLGGGVADTFGPSLVKDGAAAQAAVKSVAEMALALAWNAAAGATGKSRVFLCRLLGKLLRSLRVKVCMTPVGIKNLFDAAEKVQRANEALTGCLIAVLDALVINGTAEGLTNYQSQLMGALASLKPSSALGDERSIAFRLVVPLNVSFGKDPLKDSLPQPRVIFLLRQIGLWFNHENGKDQSLETLLLLSEVAALFANLAVIVSDVDGAHWQLMIRCCLSWLAVPAGCTGAWALRYRTYELLRLLFELGVEHTAIGEALQASHREIYSELLSSYLDDWKEASGPSGTNQLEEKSRGTAAELCQHIPRDVLVPAGRFTDLCQMLTSAVAWDQKTAAILLNRETIERVQTLSLKLEMSGSSLADDDQDPRFSLPPLLIKLASGKPSLDFVLLEASSDLDSAQLRDGLAYLLSWFILLAHFNDITFQLKAAYIRQVRNTERMIPDLMDFAFRVFGIGTAFPVFDLSVWDVTEFELPSLEASSALSFKLLAAHVVWGAMRHMPSLVRLWWSDIKDKQLSMAVESYVERQFSPKLIALETDSVRKVESSRFEKLEFRSRSANEIGVTYNVEDTASLDLMIRFPSSYPLRPVEIDGSGGSKAGVQEARWRAWILNITAVMFNQNGKVLDAISVWHRNVTLHYQGVEDCAICYSVVGVIDRTLPSKQCKTCKHKFHNACMTKWLRTSGQNLCPLCRSEL